MSNPDAQGQNNEGQQSQSQGEGNPNGFQQRIGELTAQMREYQRQVAAKDAQLQEVLLQIAQGQQQQAQQQVPQLPEGMDPSMMTAFQQVLQQTLTPFQQQMAQLQQQMTLSKVQQLAAPHDPPEVRQRAEQLIGYWQKKGLSQFNAEDALVFARGEHYSKAPPQQGQAAGAMNQYAQSTMTGQMPLPNAAAPQGAPALPSNFDSLDSDAQLQILEQRLAGKAF